MNCSAHHLAFGGDARPATMKPRNSRGRPEPCRRPAVGVRRRQALLSRTGRGLRLAGTGSAAPTARGDPGLRASRPAEKSLMVPALPFRSSGISVRAWRRVVACEAERVLPTLRRSSSPSPTRSPSGTTFTDAFARNEGELDAVDAMVSSCCGDAAPSPPRWIVTSEIDSPGLRGKRRGTGQPHAFPRNAAGQRI